MKITIVDAWDRPRAENFFFKGQRIDLTFSTREEGRRIAGLLYQKGMLPIDVHVEAQRILNEYYSRPRSNITIELIECLPKETVIELDQDDYDLAI